MTSHSSPKPAQRPSPLRKTEQKAKENGVDEAIEVYNELLEVPVVTRVAFLPSGGDSTSKSQLSCG
jgi:hypothetical protein